MRKRVGSSPTGSTNKLNMIINKDLRKIVASRILKRLTKDMKSCNPYGFTDCQDIYENICYWEDILDAI